MYYYQRIGDMRTDNDKKQTEIALHLNITQQQYSIYESGKRSIPFERVAILAEFYNVSLDWIAGRISEKYKNKYQNNSGTRNEDY